MAAKARIWGPCLIFTFLPSRYTPRYTSFSLPAPRIPSHPRRLASRSSSAATSVPLRSSRSAFAKIEDVKIGRDDQTLEPAEIVAARARTHARVCAQRQLMHTHDKAHTRAAACALSHIVRKVAMQPARHSLARARRHWSTRRRRACLGGSSCATRWSPFSSSWPGAARRACWRLGWCATDKGDVPWRHWKRL